MDFDTYLNKAWGDHGNDAATVALNFGQGLSLAQTSDHLAQLARIGTHVFGEHLGKWTDGIAFLNKIKIHSNFSADTSELQMKIYIASLALSGQHNPDLTAFTFSEQIRILTMSASAMSEQNQSDKAKDYFLKSLELVKLGLDAKDPANRSLAITGNNLAASLEQKTTRTQQDTELMILSAQIGRQFWGIAGTWKETERAEYRLSQTFLQAARYDESLLHALACLEICEINSAPALEFFFGYETLALVEILRGQKDRYTGAVQQMKKYYSQLPESEKPWCNAALAKVQ